MQAQRSISQVSSNLPVYLHYSISIILMIFIVDWDRLHSWFAVDQAITYAYGLNIDTILSLSIFSYTFIHNSFIHLLYVGIILLLTVLEPKGTVNRKTVFGTVIAAILLLPVLVILLSFSVAVVLQSLGSHVMMTELVTNTYVGSSVVAWTLVGLHRPKRKLPVIALLVLPFVYKIIVTQHLDFSPDIAHGLSYLFGSFVARYQSDAASSISF